MMMDDRSDVGRKLLAEFDLNDLNKNNDDHDFGKFLPQQPQQQQQHQHSSLEQCLHLQQLLVDEIAHLRTNCKDLLKQVECLNDEKIHWYKQCCIFRYLYTQEKHDRGRLSKLLTSSQRELEFHKRNNCNLDQASNGSSRRRKKRSKTPPFKSSLSNLSLETKSSAFPKDLKNEIINDPMLSDLKFNLDQSIDYSVQSSPVDPDLDPNRYDWDIAGLNNNPNNNNYNHRRPHVSTNNDDKKSWKKCLEFSKFLLQVNDLEKANQDGLNEANLDDQNQDDKSLEQQDLVEQADVEDAIPIESKELKLSNPAKGFLGTFFDVKYKNSVVVKQVTQNSIAYRAGIKPGDRVLEICGINLRTANYRIAEKIIRECEEKEMIVKISRQPHDSDDENDAQSKTVEPTGNDDGKRQLVKKSSLVRREAFSMKSKNHPYFQRNRMELMSLVKASNQLNINLPRRISLPQHSLENVKLCGGNAVGIFIHNPMKEELQQFLQQGDQLLTYNGMDLTNVTQEDAAIYLARSTAQVELVVLFNIDAYKQIQDNPIGDSFYIRAEFDGCRMAKMLPFKKGDVLYVDNTLYGGEPCRYWRAWRLDPFGNKIDFGSIPSKYNSDCKYAKKMLGETRIGSGPMLGSFRNLLHRLSFNSNHSRRLSNVGTDDDQSEDSTATSTTKTTTKTDSRTRILAAFTIEEDKKLSENDSSPFQEVCSYRKVKMIQPNRLKPVILLGPYNHLVAERLEKSCPLMFKVCEAKPRSNKSLDLQSSDYGSEFSEEEVVTFKDLMDISDDNYHPVVSLMNRDNLLEIVPNFHRNNIEPIVFEIRFRSAKQIKDTVNRHWIKSSSNEQEQTPVTPKLAKAMYECQVRMEKETEIPSLIVLNANNMNYLCTMIKQHVLQEQNKVFWSEN